LANLEKIKMSDKNKINEYVGLFYPWPFYCHGTQFNCTPLLETACRQITNRIYAYIKLNFKLHCVKVEHFDVNLVNDLGIPLHLKQKIIKNIKAKIAHELCWDC
jgi:hypothetical protein